MLRLFLRLYLILALVLVGFFIGANWLPNNLLKPTLADFIEDVAHGPKTLIFEHLRPFPKEQWPAQVERLSESFGYPIRLIPLEELDLAEEDMARLRQRKATFDTQDKAQIWYLPVPDSDLIVRVAMGQTSQEHGSRMTQGAFALIIRALLAVPEERRTAQFERIAGDFRVPLSLMSVAQASKTLATGDKQRLLDGAIVSFGVDSDEEWYLKRIADTDQVVKFGPLVDPLPFRVLIYLIYISLALMLAAAVWLWIRPVWRGILELRRVTAAFGRGELQTRAMLKKSAPLGHLGQTFNQMAERIQGLVESHRNLTNAVSHELRTPIARLRFGLEMLQSDQDRERHLQGMDQDIAELEELVEELLAFARFEREGFEPSEVADLATWLRQLGERELLDSQLEMKLSAADGLQANMDSRLMARALANLLRNARKYAVSQVQLSAGIDGQSVWIEVGDDGPGVPDTERERILQAFTRLDRSRDRQTGGHGLGLAIAKRVLELHGGGIEVGHSTLGGALFRLHWISGV